MVIESRYWREDLKAYAQSFRPVKSPPRWSERLVVNFEKDVTLALFMVRRLAEAGRFSSRMKNHKAQVFRCPFDGLPHRFIYQDIDELYRLEAEQQVAKGVMFVCNQFIHAQLTFAIRGDDRNWEGLYTCSDFEKKQWIYRIPLSEIIKILDVAVEDYPNSVSWRYDPEKEDYVVTTD